MDLPANIFIFVICRLFYAIIICEDRDDNMFLSITDEYSSLLARRSQISQIHPFHKGNTRSVIVFWVLLAKSQRLTVGHIIFKDNSAYVRNALVWVFTHVMDASSGLSLTLSCMILSKQQLLVH